MSKKRPLTPEEQRAKDNRDAVMGWFLYKMPPTKAKSQKPKLVHPVKNPRYDESYEEGLAWLDSLAGAPTKEAN